MRSRSCRTLSPRCQAAGGIFFAVEYIPPRRRRWTLDDFVLLFRGRYRVTEYRAERVLWFEDRAAAVAWMELARRN